MQNKHAPLKKAPSGQQHVPMSLEDDDGWTFDQFQGKKTSYRDELYTTTIDYNKVTSEVEQTAERVAKEILNADAKGNVHLAEERQQQQQYDTDETKRYGDAYDEEMKYSGVYRKEDKNSTFNRNQKNQKQGTASRQGGGKPAQTKP